MVMVSSVLAAAEVLFPQPLHITRKIDDPVSKTSTTVHEYCAGNQIVSVNGDRVTIVDYAKQEMTEIDRAAGTFSIARFDEIAKAMPATTPAPPAKRGAASNAEPPSRKWNARSLGAKTSPAGRTMEAFELAPETDGLDKVRIEVGVDNRVRLSRTAVEALIGASFPNPKRDEHDAILHASSGGRAERRQLTANANANAAANAAAEPDYALPVEQTLRVEFEGSTITLRNSILDVRNELPPDTVRQIPPGARQVESRAVRLVREARELDFPTTSPSPQP
jgi:hypothetical protein